MTRALLVVALFAALTGCHSLGRGGAGASSVVVRSLGSSATLTPALRTAIYKRTDDTTADLYFSDLPEDRLIDASDDLTDAAGSILHIHYFLEPSPGNAPIDDTACNVTVQHLIFAPGSGATRQVFGIYGGGGFFFPSGAVGDSSFGGAMRDGTHRLIHASPGFDDILGPATIGGKMSASRDDAAAGAIQARIEHYMKSVHAHHAP